MPVSVATAAELAALQARVAKLEGVSPPPPPPSRSLASILGINAHLGWNGPYANIPQAIAAIRYLGVKLVRDSCTDPATIPVWQKVAAATGVRFCDFMPEGSPALCEASLALVPQLDAARLLAFVEGANEPDDAYAAQQGMTMAWAAQFQQRVFAMGRAHGLRVINTSFGAGWTADNGWQGDYGAVGDLSAWCDYANPHTYFVGNVAPDDTIRRLGGLSLLAAKSRPIITTEFGYTVGQVADEATRAGYVVAAVKAALAAGHVGCWYYALYDDLNDPQSGRFGLFDDDGSPRASATAIRNLALGG